MSQQNQFDFEQNRTHITNIKIQKIVFDIALVYNNILKLGHADIVDPSVL